MIQIRLFSDLYLAKFVNTSAKMVFPYNWRYAEIKAEVCEKYAERTILATFNVLYNYFLYNYFNSSTKLFF